jgi:hypothetical protein
MFNRRTIQLPPQNFGKEPTTAQKLINTSKKLGIGGMQNMQGSAVNIYDSVSIITSATPQVLTFFKNTSNKAKTFTNWQNNEFKAGESLGAKYFNIHIIQLSAASLTDSATAITNFFPVGKSIATSVIAYGNMQFKIANVTIFKDYQLTELIPSFNANAQGIAAYDLTAAGVAPVIVGRSLIEMDTVPVIPPNQGIELTVEIPPITLPVGNFALMVTIGRQGSIFSAKTSL